MKIEIKMIITDEEGTEEIVFDDLIEAIGYLENMQEEIKRDI